MKDIELKLENTNIAPNSEIKGRITVNYSGRYDGVVINTQIFGSNELVVYRSYNGKKISQNVSRLFISKDNMPGESYEFLFTEDNSIEYHCEPHPWMTGTLEITKQRF